MGKRRAVGATVASVLLFGSLVLSNFLLVAGAQEREQLFSVADQENAISDQAFALRSVALLDVLDNLQLAVSASAIPCTQSLATLSALVDHSAKSITAEGEYANVTATFAQDTTALDNLTALGQYAGSVPGHLNVLASVGVRGSVSGGVVAYSKTEEHHLNLPLDLDRVVSFCLGASDRIKSGIVGLGPGTCNATLVGSLMSRFEGYYASVSTGLGFGFNLSYTLSGLPTCTVAFSISVSQQNVDGPLGNFGWSVEQAGSVFG